MQYATALALVVLSICLAYFIFQFHRLSQSLSAHKDQKKTLEALWKLEQIIVNSLNFQEVAQKISDSVLLELNKYGFVIIVLTLIDKAGQSLKRISISRTEEAITALKITPVPFSEISIPLSATENLCIRAINEEKILTSTHLSDVLVPVIDRDFASQAQTTLGVKASVVMPVKSKDKILGSLIFSLKKDEKQISKYEWDIMQGYVDAVGIALENSLLYTDLKRVTEELERANNKLLLLDKAKDEFVSLASHELRTPMTAIKSYVWMVLNDKSGPKTKDYLQLVFNSTERLIHLVNDMLDISRIESGRVQLKLAPFDMPELLKQIVDEFKARAADRKIALSLADSVTLPLVTADRDKIMQVLENLVGNSLKFTDTGGQISLTSEVSGNYLLTSVTDSGRGISEEELGKLFTKFERGGAPLSKLSEPGTGLGLYLCKQYVELHKGTISVKSKVGQGSTFTFTLPLE